jgi:hypothetical protein
VLLFDCLDKYYTWTRGCLLKSISPSGRAGTGQVSECLRSDALAKRLDCFPVNRRAWGGGFLFGSILSLTPTSLSRGACKSYFRWVMHNEIKIYLKLRLISGNTDLNNR